MRSGEKNFALPLKKTEENENAAIVYQDECSLSNTSTVSYSWSLIGAQPRIPQKQRKRERVTLFGCVEPKTGKVVAQSATHGNAKTFKRYLKKVLKTFIGKKVIMVLDNVRYHHAKCLAGFLEHNKERLELAFLPPYSPDLNPMERIWWFMRKKITHNRFIKTLKERIAVFWRIFSRFNVENSVCKNLSNICAII
jgi:putative transposase